MLDRANEYEKMKAVEDSHWWYRSLHFLIEKSLLDNCVGREARIVDAGCGTGGVMRHLAAKGFRKISGIDISEHAVALCRTDGLEVNQGDIRLIDSYFLPSSCDVILCMDVFYFIEEPERAIVLARMHSLLTDNGLLVMNLPAFNAFRGIHDRAVGIRGRFTRPQVNNIVTSNNWTIIKAVYWPFLLSPIICFARFVQRMKLRLNPDTDITSDLDMPATLINRMLYRLVRFENTALKYKPFGSSLFLVIKKR